MIVCLITISHVYSQTNSSNCTVPCYTLRNAVKTKYELELAQNKISILRDSIKINQILDLQKDTLILNKESEIKNLNTIITEKDSTITADRKRSDFYKSEYDTQVRNKWISIIIGSVSTICAIIFF